MARRDLNLDEEKRSYAGLWLLSAALLLVGAIWALLDDSFFRRPWKAYQRAFFSTEETRAKDDLAKEEAKLKGDPAYVEASKALDGANKAIASGENGKKLVDAEARLAASRLDETDDDLKVRFVKSELEEAWYEYDHAIESGGNVDAVRKRRDELAVSRTDLEAKWAETQKTVAGIQAEIDEIRSPAKTIEAKLKEIATERERLQVKIEGMKSNVANLSVSRIPAIEQIVLLDFDKNNFDEPIARVDRCTSCHSAIAKPGFEDEPNPMKTHPKLEKLIKTHPPDKFGCTSCHEGQGVALNSPAQAHGDVEFWQHPLLKGEQQQSRCIGCHLDVTKVDGAQDIKHGEYLFEQLGCHGCHLAQGYDPLPQVGPNLRREAAKVNPQWLASWIKNPYEFRPRTKMPNFMFDDEQATAVAAYIWQSSKADGDAWMEQHPDPGVDPSSADLVANGKTVFESVGCRGCHAISPDEVATPLGAVKDWGPNLQKIAQKTNPRFVYWWVKNPHDYSPKTFMPSLRLSDDEAKSVTAYLMSLSAGPAPEGAVTVATLEDPQKAEQGKAIIRKYGCYGCHQINGMDSESRIGVELSAFGGKGVEELFFGSQTEIPRTWNDWTFNKLKNPRIYQTEHVEQLMPNFYLADEDVRAIRAWLQSRIERVPPPKWQDPQNVSRWQPFRDGRRIVEFYNCQGCHQIDGQGGNIRRLYEDNPTAAPPMLINEGAKVQPQWLYGFLQAPARQPLRFWLKVRMPTFGFDSNQRTKVVNYFNAGAKLDDPYFFWDPAIDSTPVQLDEGKKLMSQDYFSCWSCHVRGSETPAGPPEQWAPNLAYAHERLNPHWILGWLKNPQALMPGTKMPAFYEEGQAGPDDVFGGNVDQQIAAMRDYIMSLGAAGGAVQAAGVPGYGGATAPAAAAAPAPAVAPVPARAQAPGPDGMASAQAHGPG